MHKSIVIFVTVLSLSLGASVQAASTDSQHAGHGGSQPAAPPVSEPFAPRRVAVPPSATTFLQTYCVECHDADVKKGNLDIAALSFQLGTSKVFDTWVTVHDRVRDDEMPPKKSKTRPSKSEIDAFLSTIAQPMVAADQQRAAAEGRSVWRRLNRYEYENALCDLLNVPWLQVKEMLPEDGESHRFNKAGEALDVSHVQMSSYLNAADYALRQAMASQSAQPPTKTVRYWVRDQRNFTARMKYNDFNKSAERATTPLLGSKPQPDVLTGKAPITAGASDPATRELEAIGVVASTYEPMEIRFEQFEAPVSGHYKLRFSTYSYWAGSNGGSKWWNVDRMKVSAGRTTEPVTIYSDITPRILRLLGSFDARPEPSVAELDVMLLKGETIRPDAARLFRSRPPAYRNPLAEKDGAPGVAFQWMDVEGPIYDQWPPAGHQLMFGDLPVKPATPQGDPAKVLPKNPPKDAERLLRRFIAAAYRRPVNEPDVQRFLSVIDSAMKSGSRFTDAMIAGYTAVLCSPGFVCLQEEPGRLDDYALAARLAFFLWNSAPDAELRDIAAKGELHRPEILRAQTDRLLNDPKSKNFVEAFLDYWLDLRKIVATAPDGALYPDYYLDDLLTESAQQETQLFFAELLKDNLPARNIVASDFTMLNERLAKHYGIDDVKGVAMRRVRLPQESPRGGLLTQASVLKVTANGTTTSPVLRGAWIMERILGKPPPPPPPSVPAIEPDTRGAVTIRQQLEKHRTTQTCAACHAKIDPAGFALESFDVMGGWRDHYRALGDGTPVEGIGHNGQKYAFHNGPAVDAGGELPDGRHFADIREFKSLLLADERQIARNLAQQLVVYSTGGRVRFGDRPEIEKILDRAGSSEFGVRSLIREVVQSELFQTK